MPVHSPGHHLRHEHRLLLGLAVHDQRRGGAHGQAAIHRKRHIGRALEFVDGLAQRHRQALPAIFRRRRQPEPAALGDLPVGFLEAFRRGHAAVVMADTALEIADPVERLQHLFAEFGGLVQDRLAHVGGGVAKAGKIVVAVDLKHVVEQESDVFQRGFVDRHDVLPAAGKLFEAEVCSADGNDSEMDLSRFLEVQGSHIRQLYRAATATIRACDACRRVYSPPDLASCSPIKRCSRLIALSGRTITLKCVIRPSSSKVMMSTPLIRDPHRSRFRIRAPRRLSLRHSPIKRKLGPPSTFTALDRYLKVMSRPRCGVCTTGLSNTASGWSKSHSAAGSWDLTKSYHLSSAVMARTSPAQRRRRVGQQAFPICILTHYATLTHKVKFMHFGSFDATGKSSETGSTLALGDAILACLTEHPMTGYELAKTFDASIGFFWKADHQQIYRELTRLRDRGHIQGREVVQSGKPNKLVYTLTPEGRAALRHWAARPSAPASIKDDLLVRLYALDSVDIEPLRADLMARLEHHRDRFCPLRAHPEEALSAGHRSAGRHSASCSGFASALRYERAVAEWCEEALDALSALSARGVGRIDVVAQNKGRLRANATAEPFDDHVAGTAAGVNFIPTTNFTAPPGPVP